MNCLCYIIWHIIMVDSCLKPPKKENCPSEYLNVLYILVTYIVPQNYTLIDFATNKNLILREQLAAYLSYMTCSILLHHPETYLDHRFSFCHLIHKISQGLAYCHGTCDRLWQELKWMFLV
jgi:hypothetical protein